MFHARPTDGKRLDHEKAIVAHQAGQRLPDHPTAQLYPRRSTCRYQKLADRPYVQATNQLEVNYLSETGYTVLHEKDWRSTLKPTQRSPRGRKSVVKKTCAATRRLF